MVMAADYPFMDVLWSMIIFFFWVIWIWIVITVLIDIFRRHDIGGWAKAAWVIFVVDPALARRADLSDRRARRDARAQHEAGAGLSRREFDQYVRDSRRRRRLRRRDREGQGAARQPARSRSRSSRR